MVLVPTSAPYVVPRIRLMTQEALVDLGVFLTGDHFRHHLEMHHVVARRRLMALGAITRGGRWMKEPCDSPSGRIVAVGAVAPKQFPVRIAIAVTACADQPVFLGRLRHPHSEKGRHIVHHLA